MPIATHVQDYRELCCGLERPFADSADPVTRDTSATDGPRGQAPVSEVLDDPAIITHRLEDLPKELGILLASVGVLGIVLPGIAGTPALIAGGLVLWPKTFGRVENWFQIRFPLAHRKSMQQVGRFLDDLERRYPLSEESRS